MSKPVTSKTVTNSLFWALRSASDLIIPRYTPRNWWECDVWRLTKSQYVDEFEIKLSVSDFKADAEKEKSWAPQWQEDVMRFQPRPPRNKHEILATTEEGPNRFWFVVPESLLEKIEVPAWAGVMIFSGSGHPWIKRQAPKRHTRKWDGNRAKLLETFYHRYCNHEFKAPEFIDPSPIIEEI